MVFIPTHPVCCFLSGAVSPHVPSALGDLEKDGSWLHLTLHGCFVLSTRDTLSLNAPRLTHTASILQVLPRAASVNSETGPGFLLVFGTSGEVSTASCFLDKPSARLTELPELGARPLPLLRFHVTSVHRSESQGHTASRMLEDKQHTLHMSCVTQIKIAYSPLSAF